MDVFLVLVLLIGFIVAIIGIVLLILNFVRKRPKKKALKVLGTGVAIFAISMGGIYVYANSSSYTASEQSTAQDESSSETESSSSNSETSSAKTKGEKLKFGETAAYKVGSSLVEMTVNSVDQVNADDMMVADVSSNDTSKKQFVIVNYTVKVTKGTVSLDDFDGYELTIADSENAVGSTSSNRDGGAPDELHQGQSIKLRIGAGFDNTGDTATIGFLDDTWTGAITK